MSIRIVFDNKTMVLNKSFRVRGLPLGRELPSTVIDGADGEIVHKDSIRIRPRMLVLEGKIYGNNPEETEESLNDLYRAIHQLDTVKLFIGDNSQYYNAMYQDIDHRFEEGTGRKVATIEIVFVCHDPFKYSENPIRYFKSVNNETITYEYEGLEKINPIVCIKGNVNNIKIFNQTTDEEIVYKEQILNGEIVILDCFNITAKIEETSNFNLETYPVPYSYTFSENKTIENSVLKHLNDGFKIGGFSLVPGTNQIKVEANNGFELYFLYRDKWL